MFLKRPMQHFFLLLRNQFLNNENKNIYGANDAKIFRYQTYISSQEDSSDLQDVFDDWTQCLTLTVRDWL